MSPALLLGIFLTLVPSRYTAVTVDIAWDGSEKETTVTYRAVAGDDGRFLRVTRDFDPAYMEVELISSQYGFDDAMRDVPEWAVDTLTGSEGWPRALVAAFPGLRPGMNLEWTFRVRENGYLSAAGLFYTYIAGDQPDTITVRCQDIDGLQSAYSGFEESEESSHRVFTSINREYKELWLSTCATWQDAGDILLASSREAGSLTPPDLREAAIEAGAAGALPRMRISRGRVLITESMQLLPFPGGDSGFQVRSLQEILDSRRATPMEAATLLSAMCRVMGIDAPVVPATDIMPPIPSPLGFYRAFIMADGNLEEPSEYLSPAGWVDMPDTLWLLLPGGLLGELPPETLAESCKESWNILPDEGFFSLSIETTGGFDRELRRKLVGRSQQEMLLSVSEWFRASEIFFYPDSVVVSDFFDLTEPASIHVSGRFHPASQPWIETAPSLNWNRSGSVERNYTGVTRASGVITR